MFLGKLEFLLNKMMEYEFNPIKVHDVEAVPCELYHVLYRFVHEVLTKKFVEMGIDELLAEEFAENLLNLLLDLDVLRIVAAAIFTGEKDFAKVYDYGKRRVERLTYNVLKIIRTVNEMRRREDD